MRRFGTSKATGRRVVPRNEAHLIAMLSNSTEHYQAAVLDISRTGARLAADTLPPVGRELLFRAENVRAVAEVVWSDGAVCALEFDTPLAAAEVQHLRSLRPDEWRSAKVA